VQAVQQSLASTLSKVHVSFDVWTSPTQQAFLSIIVYFVDNTGKRYTRMLGLPRLFDTHTGENQAGVLQQVFALYGLDDVTHVGFFMVDLLMWAFSW